MSNKRWLSCVLILSICFSFIINLDGIECLANTMPTNDYIGVSFASNTDADRDIASIGDADIIDSLGYSNPFSDVRSSDNFYEAVLWATNANPQIVAGITSTKFKPYNICNRAQAVTFLWRMKGCPEPGSFNNPFDDVKPSDFFYKPVLWAYSNGITSGVSSNSFGVVADCSRAQFATFLWNAFNKPEPNSSVNPFDDVGEGKFYTKAIIWAYENGIVSGKSNIRFDPKGVVNRGQVVMFLYRSYFKKSNYTTFLNGVDYSDVYDYNFYINKYPDLKKAFGDDENKTLNHFVNFGMKEGRQAKADFNVFAYICKYSDLRNVYRYNYKSYYSHFMRNGKKEGRVAFGNYSEKNAMDSIEETTGIAKFPEQYKQILFAAKESVEEYCYNYGSMPIFFDIDEYDYVESIEIKDVSKWGYYTYDFNEDGIYELVLCVGNVISKMFTIIDEHPVLIMDSDGEMYSDSILPSPLPGEPVLHLEGVREFRYYYIGDGKFFFSDSQGGVCTKTLVCNMNYKPTQENEYSYYLYDHFSLENNSFFEIIDGYSRENYDYYLRGYCGLCGSGQGRRSKINDSNALMSLYNKYVTQIKTMNYTKILDYTE